MAILIVDDEKDITGALEILLKHNCYQVISAQTGEEALEIVREKKPELVLLDIMLPGINGIEVLSGIKKIDSSISVIMMSSVADMKTVVEAMKLGAFDYATKPFDIKELLPKIAKALKQRARTEKSEKGKESSRKADHELVGKNRKMVEIYKTIGKIASTTTTVLIYGESGSGKELIARAVHLGGTRRNGPFVPVDCATISASIMESELFGHEKGAFTDAINTKIGKFELADGGTIFLDEISNINLEIQAKLLRVLQEKKITRVGGIKEIDIDIRVIAATNRDLKEEVRKGRFREDLFFRLNVVPLHVPPLRERKDDIPLLAEYFIRKYTPAAGEGMEKIEKETMEMLLGYDWPGNVRELEHVIERAVVMGDKSDMITSDDFPEEIRRAYPEPKQDFDVRYSRELLGNIIDNKIPLHEVLDRIEKQLILESLKKTGWNHLETSKVLGLATRQLLEYKMKKYKIKDQKQ